jgi:hypothetical protein
MNIKQITISLTIGVILGVLSPIFSYTLAQTAQDLGNFPSNERDPNSGNLGADINPMKLMHQLQMSNGRSMSDFVTDSNRNIDSAASDFKKQQQQMILQQRPKLTDNNSVETEPKN